MPLDSNGIWQYAETDLVSPVSTLLNRLGSSTSNKVATLSSQITTLSTLANGIGLWQAQTPVFNDFIQGTSTVVARWTRVGKTVHVWGQIYLVGGYAFNSASVKVSLPVAPYSNGWSDARIVGHWGMVRPGVGYWSGEIRPETGSRVFLRSLTATTPVGPSSGDVITWQLTYEAA